MLKINKIQPILDSADVFNGNDEKRLANFLSFIQLSVFLYFYIWATGVGNS